MQKKLFVLVTCITLDAAASSTTSVVASRKRSLVEELKERIEANPTSSGVPSSVTTRTRAVVVKEPVTAKEPVVVKETAAVPAVSAVANRPQLVIDPQEALKSDISNLLSSLSSSIADGSRTRLALYIASCIAREEKQKQELDDFTGRLSAIIQQLGQIKGIIAKQPSVYRAFRLKDTNICCGKEVVFVVDLLYEIEAAVLGQQWGRVIDFDDSKTKIERPSDYVNEDFIAGSWIAFLDARLHELESTRAMQNYLERSSSKNVQTVLTNRIIQVRELCLLLRDAALNKKLGSEYREVIKELLNPSTSNGEASTSSNQSKRRRTASKHSDEEGW